jgi:hypothetical protein
MSRPAVAGFFASSRFARCALAAALLAPGLALGQSAAPAPEIRREPYPPQAPGSVHTIRILPEACAYLQGGFAAPAGAEGPIYRYGARRTAGRCQPRARLVDPAQARPSAASGWVLNDLIRIPNADCPAQQAVIRVWRKPADTAALRPDAQGRPRIYLEEAKRRAESGALPSLPQYAAVLEIEGRGCVPAAR